MLGLSKISAGAFIACVIVLALALDDGAWGMGKRPPVVGIDAPDFMLHDLDGHRRRLSDYRGQIVLLNFWATWCKPCTTEMPAMQAQYDQLRDRGFVVLAVNELEDTEKVREHIRTYQHTFPVLLDTDNRVANLYGVFGLPVSVFIDQAGRVQEYIKGGLLTEDRIREVVTRLQEDAGLRSATLR